jgi:hypothetical protein
MLANLKLEVGGSLLEAGPGKNGRLYRKNKLKAKRTGDVAQVLEYLPSIHKALN